MKPTSRAHCDHLWMPITGHGIQVCGKNDRKSGADNERREKSTRNSGGIHSPMETITDNGQWTGAYCGEVRCTLAKKEWFLESVV